MAREVIIERLANLDTCAVSEGLDRLGLKGATYGVRPMWSCPKIVGRAVTMKIKPAGLDKPKQHLGTAAIVAADGMPLAPLSSTCRTMPVRRYG